MTDLKVQGKGVSKFHQKNNARGKVTLLKESERGEARAGRRVILQEAGQEGVKEPISPRSLSLTSTNHGRRNERGGGTFPVVHFAIKIPRVQKPTFIVKAENMYEGKFRTGKAAKMLLAGDPLELPRQPENLERFILKKVDM